MLALHKKTSISVAYVYIIRLKDTFVPFFFRHAQLDSTDLVHTYPVFALCQHLQFGYICMTIACLFRMSPEYPERQFGLYTVIMVLPAVSMNTDHVFGLRPAANCSCCNLS